MREVIIEPQPRDLIQLLDLQGFPSDTYSRVRGIISYDRHEELWEVRDSLNQCRYITALRPSEWLEVDYEP